MLSWKDHVRTASVMLFSMENRNTAYVMLGLISGMIRSFIVGNFIIGVFLSSVQHGGLRTDGPTLLLLHWGGQRVSEPRSLISG